MDKEELMKTFGINTADMVKSVRVVDLWVEWQIYRYDVPSAKVERICRELNKAASYAIEHKNRDAWYRAQHRFADDGAADTEPSTQFDALWILAYGEDE
jgi:hypothetical protein